MDIMNDIRIEYEIIWTQSKKVFDGIFDSKKNWYVNPNLEYNSPGYYYAYDCLNKTRCKTLENAMFKYIKYRYSETDNCPVYYVEMKTIVIVNEKEYDFSNRSGLDKQEGNYFIPWSATMPDNRNKKERRIDEEYGLILNELKMRKAYLDQFKDGEKMYQSWKNERKSEDTIEDN